MKKYLKLCSDLGVEPAEIPEALKVALFKLIPSKLKPATAENTLAVAVVEYAHSHSDISERSLSSLIKGVQEKKGQGLSLEEARSAVAAAGDALPAVDNTATMTPEQAEKVAQDAIDAVKDLVDNPESCMRRAQNSARVKATEANIPFDAVKVREALAKLIAKMSFEPKKEVAAEQNEEAVDMDQLNEATHMTVEQMLANAFKAVPPENDIPQLPWVSPEDAPTPVEAAYRKWLLEIGQDPASHAAFLAAHAPNDGVVTRFPPEPNGFLHIGHAKAIMLDFGFAKVRGGVTYMRFDDTNPAKEDQQFVDMIQEDVRWLGHEPWKVTYTSDYFDYLYNVAEYLIKVGKAYVDDQTPEEMAAGRKDHIPSPYSTRTPEVNLALFRAMAAGRFPEGSRTLRLKMDMSSDITTLLDPVAYRIIYLPHHHTGRRWCIYPSYDMSHCLIDAYEHITHSMCTLEFNVRRPSYHWLTEAALGYRPMQWEMSKMVLSNCVTSKRCINEMIRLGIISGYDDPRLPTLQGLRRRGFTAEIINRFVLSQGFTRNDTAVIPIWALDVIARAVFDQSAPRALSVMEPLEVRITDRSPRPEVINMPLFPREGETRHLSVALANRVFVERSDFSDEDAVAGKLEGRVIGLRYGPLLQIDKVIMKNGHIERMEAHSQGVDAAPEFRLHWAVPAGRGPNDSRVAEVRDFSLLFLTHDVDRDFDKLAGQCNPDSITVHRNALVPAAVADCQPEDHWQFQRLGYYVADRVDHVPGKHPVFNRTVTLVQPKPTFTGLVDEKGWRIMMTFSGDLTAINPTNGARRSVKMSEYLALREKAGK